jgi:hypothetical protein
VLTSLSKNERFRNIDFLGRKRLLRLAAQKESDKAQTGLLRRMSYAGCVHKNNYIKEEKILQIIFEDFAGMNTPQAGKNGGNR